MTGSRLGLVPRATWPPVPPHARRLPLVRRPRPSRPRGALGRWWQRLGLRKRLMVLGLVGLIVGFALGGLALVGTLRTVMLHSVDMQALAEAQDVAATIDRGETLPTPLPATGFSQVQVVDGSGQVVASSREASTSVAVLPPDDIARVRAGEWVSVDDGDEPVRVVGVGVGSQTVLVARDLVDVRRGVLWLTRSMLVTLPVIVLVLAIVGWRAIGATLRPVEELRQGAAAITDAGERARLPVPIAADELHRLAVTLNDMLDRLDAGRARQREFAGDAAHELRSPLANMRTQLEVALAVDPGPAWPSVARDLLTDTERMSRLVADLLVLARADDTTALVNPAPVALAPLLSDVASRFDSSDPPQSGATVALGPLDPLWTIAERGAVERVVTNLLENAVRHAKSSVVLSLRTEPEWCVIMVVDDGAGIPVADRDRVFERFTRLDDGVPGGSGLGLAIVRELVRRHQGTVTLLDGPTGGLLVEVRLPRADPPR